MGQRLSTQAFTSPSIASLVEAPSATHSVDRKQENRTTEPAKDLMRWTTCFWIIISRTLKTVLMARISIWWATRVEKETLLWSDMHMTCPTTTQLNQVRTSAAQSLRTLLAPNGPWIFQTWTIQPNSFPTATHRRRISFLWSLIRKVCWKQTAKLSCRMSITRDCVKWL